MHTVRAADFHGSSRFDVLRQVGQGGLGAVYEAIDKESGTHVALKTLHTHDPESLLLLKNEFRSIQDMAHANLVTPMELFEADGQWFFSMEFIDGVDFLSYARSSQRPEAGEPTAPLRDQRGDRAHNVTEFATGVCSEVKLRSVLTQLAAGVCALHAEHKVHRDLKPSNVLVDASGHVRILDFGIVLDMKSTAKGEDFEGEIVGTIAYMAPEQASGEAITPAADWYAVGVMLYEALTGRPPFVGAVGAILASKATEIPPAPAALDPTVSADLSELCVDLLKIAPAERPEGFEVLARLGAAALVARPPRAAGFVGRTAELEALRSAFNDVATGRGVTVLVEGESGVGKSWLIREFTSRAPAESGVLVLRGRCYERESVPYKALDSVIDDLAAFLSALSDEDAAALLPEEAALLVTLFPVLERVPSIRATLPTRFEVKDPQEARAQMFALLRTLLTNVALYRPLVMVVDDLQWADADSVALLGEILRPPAAPPVLLLGSIRSATLTTPRGVRLYHHLEELPGDVRWVRLDPLPDEDARALIRTLLADAAGGDVPAEAIEAIQAEAKGHPLYIDELVRHRSLHEAKTKARLDDAIHDRAAYLPPAARKLLELVAVSGVPIEQRVAAQAAALDFAQVYAAVGELRAGHFVRTSGVYRHDTVDAYHDRVRHSILAHLSEETRKEWHGRLAVALEQSGAVEAEKLIAHWKGAGEPERAAGYAVKAADDAAAALAFDHAASLYRVALELGAEAGRTAEAGTALRLKMAEALANAGRGADAAAAYFEAAGGARTDAAVDMRRRAAEALFGVGHIEQGTEAIRGVLRAAGIWWAARPAAVLLGIVFYTVVLAIRGLRFTPRKESEIDPRALLRVDCLASAGTIAMTDHVRGKLFQLRTLVEALRLGEPARVGRALGMYASGNASTGLKVFAKTMAQQKIVADMGERLGDPSLLGLALLVEGFALFLSGRYSEACPPFVRTELILRDECVGMGYPLQSSRAFHYFALGYRGDFRELALRVEAALASAELRGDRFSVANFRATAMPLLALTRDDPAGAERELDLAAEQLPKDGFHVQHHFHLHGRSQAAMYRGAPEEALARINEQLPALRRSMLLYVQTLRIGVHDLRARACVAALAAGGRAELGGEAMKEIRAIEGEGMPWAASLAQLLRAGLAAVAGERGEALAQLERAEQSFEAQGLSPSRAAAQRARGLLLGGEEGKAMVAAAEERLRGMGVKNPGRFAELLAPGVKGE